MFLKGERHRVIIPVIDCNDLQRKVRKNHENRRTEGF
jgi:hypothetical protein